MECSVLWSVLLLSFVYTEATDINNDANTKTADSYFFIGKGNNLTNGFNVLELPRDKRALGLLLRGFMEAMGYTVSPIQMASIMNPSTAATGQLPTAPAPPPSPPKQPVGSASSPKPTVAATSPRQRETIKFTGVVNFGNNSNANLLSHLKRYENIFHGPRNATSMPAAVSSPRPAPLPPPLPPPTKKPSVSWKPPIDPRSLPPLLEPFFVKIPLPIAPDLESPLLSAAKPFKKTSEKEYSNHEDVEKYEEESKEIDSPKDVKMIDRPHTSHDNNNYRNRKPIEHDSDEREESYDNNDEDDDSKKSGDDETEDGRKYSENDENEEDEEDESRPTNSRAKADSSDEDYPIEHKSDSDPKYKDYKGKGTLPYNYENKSYSEGNRNEDSNDDGSVEEERHPPRKYNVPNRPLKDYSESTEAESDSPDNYKKSQSSKPDDEDYEDADFDDEYPGFKKFTDFEEDDEEEEERSSTVRRPIKNVLDRPEIKDNEQLPISYDREKSKHDQPIQDSYGEYLEKPGISDDRVSSYFTMFKDTESEPHSVKPSKTDKQRKKIKNSWNTGYKSDYNPNDGYDRIKNEYALPLENKYEEYDIENEQYPAKEQHMVTQKSDEQYHDKSEVNDKDYNKQRSLNGSSKKTMESSEFPSKKDSKNVSNNRGSRRYATKLGDSVKTTSDVNNNFSKNNKETGRNPTYRRKGNSTAIVAEVAYTEPSSIEKYNEPDDHLERTGQFGDKVSNKSRDRSRKLTPETEKKPERRRGKALSKQSSGFEKRSELIPLESLAERKEESKQTQIWPAPFDYTFDNTDLRSDAVFHQSKEDSNNYSGPQRSRGISQKQTKGDKTDKKYKQSNNNVTKLAIQGHVVFHQPKNLSPTQNKKSSRREETTTLRPSHENIKERKEKIQIPQQDQHILPDNGVKFINGGHSPSTEVNFDNIHNYYPIPGYSPGPDIYSQFFPATNEPYALYPDYGGSTPFVRTQFPPNGNPSFISQPQIVATPQFHDPESAREFFGFGKSDYDFSNHKLPLRKSDDELPQRIRNDEGNSEVLPTIPDPAPYYYDERLTEFTDEPESNSEVLKVKEYRNKIDTVKVTEYKEDLPDVVSVPNH